MTTQNAEPHRARWARFRFSIIDPLLASPPEKGQLQNALQELANKPWLHPVTTLPVTLGLSTIERWYYHARKETDPIKPCAQNNVKMPVSGEPGTGKSVALRLLAERSKELRDVSVGVISLPSGRLTDFYREMGDLFGIELSPHNRWDGFRKLRERWTAHLESTLTRPVLLIDEA